MIYLAGIDTLFVGFYLSKFNLTDEDWFALNEAKEEAKAPVFKSSGYLITFKGIDFVMSPAGKKPYTFILQHSDFTLKLAQKVSKSRFPEIFIELRSQLLWRLGHREIYYFMWEWVSTWADIASNVVSRADAAVDVNGFPDISIENVVSRGRKSKSYLQLVPIEKAEIYYYASRITGWVFGSGSLMLRIYNKLIESRLVHKEWFHDLWKVNGWDGESDVARVEMQMRREFLKDFNVTTFESFEKSLGDIFGYVTGDWFSLREPLSDKNRSRWPVTPFWSEVQGSIKNFGKSYGLTRERIKQTRKTMLLPQAAGLITSIAAMQDEFSFDELFSECQSHFRKKGSTFNAAVVEKKKRNSLLEDGYEPF